MENLLVSIGLAMMYCTVHRRYRHYIVLGSYCVEDLNQDVLILKESIVNLQKLAVVETDYPLN